MTKTNYDPDFHPKDLIRRMGLGEIDVSVMSGWGISIKTFYLWLQTYPELKEAAEIGYPQWESAWLKKGEEQAYKGNNAYHKYWNTVMGVKAHKAYKAALKGDAVNVNINQINVLENKSEVELLEIFQDKLLKLQRLNPTIKAEYKVIEAKDDSE